ncbi:MAG: roadblock/LC7 domain-containing protein [Micromonosporaceae bacterium]|nr:roadblock/LC7 domain-containing protein [Micromonosporaceae bacterium]
MTAPTTRPDTDYLLTAYTQEVPDVRHAIAVSVDGLLISHSAGLPRDHADRLAAVAAGLASLTHSVAAFLHTGTVRQHIIDTDNGFVIVMSLGARGNLLAVTRPDADMGHVGYTLGLLADRVGDVLDPDQRVPRTL